MSYTCGEVGQELAGSKSKLQYLERRRDEMLPRLSDMLWRVTRDDDGGSVAFQRRLWKTLRLQILAHNASILSYPPAELLKGEDCFTAIVRSSKRHVLSVSPDPLRIKPVSSVRGLLSFPPQAANRFFISKFPVDYQMRWDHGFVGRFPKLTSPAKFSCTVLLRKRFLCYQVYLAVTILRRE